MPIQTCLAVFEDVVNQLGENGRCRVFVKFRLQSRQAGRRRPSLSWPTAGAASGRTTFLNPTPWRSHDMHYNFARIHRTLRNAIHGGGLTNRVWSIKDLIGL